jgi:2-keto-3-deoxy-L-rhamnonate aldolase RhmA
MRKNETKARLKAGECVYGTSLEECLNPEMAVLLRVAGMDCFFVDTEHSPADYLHIQALCRAAFSAGITPMVRVTQDEPALITRALDCGAMGVIVPRVHSVAQARNALRVMKYPPLGNRGYGMRGIMTDFQWQHPTAMMESTNQETLAILQVESKEALAEVEQIAATPHLDVLFIGPYDLTISMGIPEQFGEEFWSAVGRVCGACRNAGIAAGIQSADIGLLKKAKSLGVRFVLYSSDHAVLMAGYRSGLSAVREDGRSG